jgi:hypothetical protein
MRRFGARRHGTGVATVLIDIRSKAGDKRALGTSVEAVSGLFRAASEGTLDPETTRAVLDWVQYRHSFRPMVLRREILDPHARLHAELAIDLRQVDGSSYDRALEAACVASQEPSGALEQWVPLSKSCIWRFNALYWQELDLWEKVAGHGYAQALPGGESSGTNRAATRAAIEELFAVWDGLAARRALPDQLTVLELGVGSGDQARVWLDEFRSLDAEQGGRYYRRLQYLMGDYSPHVLERARSTVAEHGERVSTLVLDAAHPRTSLRFLDAKVFFVYISNVYDNLPTDELAVIDDTFYLVEVRAHLCSEAVDALARRFELEPVSVVPMATRLLRLGPRLLSETEPASFPDEAAATSFWQEVWWSLRLAERYVPLGPLDCYEVADGICAEVLGYLVDGCSDVRIHASNGAIASFLETVPLLHPLGSLISHDLYVTDLYEYRTGFRGPGKYDGSVVNWVNGPLLQALAGRRGFDVEFAPFDHATRSPIATARARARD